MTAPKLLDQVRQTTRMRLLSLRTEQAYGPWIRQFIVFSSSSPANVTPVS